MPLTNRWCCQTKNESSVTPSRPPTASRYPHSGFRANTGQDLQHDREAGQREDVHLRMSEEPEEVLVQERAPPLAGDEEVRLRGAVEDRHRQRRDQHRRREHHQHGGREDAPHEDRQPRPGQARRAHGHDRRDHVEPEQRHRDADEREEEVVAVHPRIRLGAERLVARPAGREAAEEDRRLEDDAGRHQQPERQRLDARERHAPRADQDRDEVVGERAEDPARHHPHHHRAVQADERQIRAGREDLVSRTQELGADEHRVQAADEEEEADADEVLDADDLVVGAEAEVAADPARLLLRSDGG